MNAQHASLIAAGAVATGVIAFGATLAERPNPGLPVWVVVLLGVYAVGLGLGRLLFRRG
jgi:hypothetical protein